MDTAHPISSVIPSLEGQVLEVLAGTTAPLNLVMVTKLGGDASVSGVRLALLRLVQGGLVIEVPGGYLLNRDHLAASAVEALAALAAHLFERMTDAVNSWELKPQLVGVFGSTARRDGDAESDIDVVVVSDQPGTAASGAELAQLVEIWTGNACHVVTVSSADLRRMRRHKEPVLAEWERDLVVLAGDKSVLSGEAS